MLTGSGNQDGPFQSAVDLLTKLGSSTTVNQCFVRHSFAYWLGRLDAPGDGCSMAAVATAFGKNGDYVELLASLFSSRSFLFRNTK
jgi:hypothetical protein